VNDGTFNHFEHLGLRHSRTTEADGSRRKPTIAEFEAFVTATIPGAEVRRADRGLAITVSTIAVAQDLEAIARGRGLTIPERGGLTWDRPDSVTLRVFGFPRGRSEVAS
jgi:hypothetical protein